MFNISADNRVDSDRALVTLAKQGDRAAFEQLIKRHYQTCVNMASFMLHDRGEAQDEVQEACWKAFEHLDQYHGDAEFVTWMLRIVVNQCLMLLRVRRRTRFFYIDDDGGQNGGRPMELPAATPDPEHEVVSSEMEELLRKEISHIPPLLRNVILLRDLQELPMSAVAAHLGISVAAAKSRLLRARTELRNRVLEKSGSARHRLPVASRLPARSHRRVVWMG
jgi:RNA polymerase sigma-70 factor (ECF subfamily)